MVGLPVFNTVLGQATGTDILTNPWLNAGGMGILGFILYRYIHTSQVSLKELSIEHSKSLDAVVKELHGLREDMVDEIHESRRLLTIALGLGPAQKERPPTSEEP